MKNEKVIRKKLEVLQEILGNKDLEEEVIMGGRQRVRIRIKIDILKWVLDIEKN